jgi:hypothetical protein
VDVRGQPGGAMVVSWDDGKYHGLWFERDEETLYGKRLFNVATLEEVAAYARDHDVRWVMPTPHCARTEDLAVLAELIGDINYPSPALVRDVEDKRRFYEILHRAGEPVPETHSCTTAGDIAHAVRAIGSLCIVKTDGGHSSLGLKTIDGSSGLIDEDLRNIDDHIAVRDAKRHGGSIVQEYVGDEEYGMQAMLEVSEVGVDFVWHMTTRKIVLPPYGRLSAHVLDPADERRIELTRQLLLPAARRGVEALLAGKSEMQRCAIGRYVLNCDWRTDGASAWWIDGSFRWAPHFQQAGNTTLGLYAFEDTFPRIARLWAQGVDVPKCMLTPLAKPRAVIMGKAFAGTGGRLVRLGREPLLPDPAVFYCQIPADGEILPSPYEESRGVAIDVFPLICSDGKTIQEAQTEWYSALKSLRLVVERDGRQYGPESERPFTDYYASSLAA